MECKQKVKYSTRAKANGVLSWLKAELKAGVDKTTKAYHCKTCGYFHLGKNDKRKNAN